MRIEDQKKARKLRRQGWTLPEIATEVDAGKGLVSLWVRDVEISKAGKARLLKRKEGFDKAGRLNQARAAWSLQRKEARSVFREEGRKAAKKGETLHALACALYWAEGSKSRNSAVIINGDINILRVFLSFYRTYFSSVPGDIKYRVTGYTNVYSSKKMISYWVRGLDLKGCEPRVHRFDDFRYSTRGVSGKRVGKLPYGLCTIILKNSTRVIQHIYGALEVYGGAVIDPKR